LHFCIQELAAKLQKGRRTLRPIQARLYIEGVVVKLRSLTFAAVLCLSTIILPRASAQNLVAAEPQSMERMHEEGWQTVQEGVLQRDLGEGRVETYSFGEQGRRWRAQRLAERIASLEREYRSYPSERLAAILATLKGELRQSSQQAVEEDGEVSLASASLSTGEIDSVSATLTAGCEPTVTLGANAAPLSTQVPGSTASAHVSFQAPTDCFGSTYAYAYSRATSGSTMNDDSQEDSQSDGTVLAASLSVSAIGSADCFSESFSQASIQDRTYQVSDTNYACAAGPSEATPYGLPFKIPGTIKAADFDNGGEGVAYHEVTPNPDSVYRATGVDLYEDIVVWLEAGDWMQYTLDVQAAGTYTLVAQIGAQTTGGVFHLELDGVDVTGPVAVPATGGWSDWRAAIRNAVKFPAAGQHTLRFKVDAGFDGFQSLRFVVAQAPFGGTARTLPGTIKAVDFDEGGEMISYHDHTAGCEGSCGYRTADVDRWEKVVYQTTAGEWMKYTVDVAQTGVYTMLFKVGSYTGGGTFHVEVDGVNVTGPLTLPNTGGWNPTATVTKTGVSLTAGRRVMRLVIDGSPGSNDAGTFDTITVQP
jgi:hypothetical protein